MCLLTFFPEGQMPDEEALLNGTEVNNDGHGYAIVHGRNLLIRRGLNAGEIIDSFMVDRGRLPHGPALFHSRMSTHGAEDIKNCHPFNVGGDPRTVLAHNGILPSKVHPGKGDRRSDTRIAAEDFIPRFGPLRRRKVRAGLERWMSPANKMVILTVDPKFQERAYILNEEAGIWDGGIWYSNDWYRPWKYSTRHLNHFASYYAATSRDGTLIDEETHCLDCMERYEDCLCYWAGKDTFEKKWGTGAARTSAGETVTGTGWWSDGVTIGKGPKPDAK